MTQEKVTDIISASSEALTAVDGIITSIYKSHMRKYERADNYLATVILEKGTVSDEDVNIAAQLYGIPMLRKKYRNIAKTLNKADALCKKRTQETKEEVNDIDDDLLTYLLDRASNISEESIQSIFACVLTQECCVSGSMRKVMIDRLALLDKKSAHLFSTLCQLTYNVEVDDGRSYCIPLYLRDDILVELVNSKVISFSEEQAVEYQHILALAGQELDFQLSDLESELDILQEIGLINVSETGDESDIYSTKSSSFCFRVGAEEVGHLSLFDDEQRVYFACTGNVTYTKMGLDLYNALKSVYPPYSGLYDLLKAYIQLQESR